LLIWAASLILSPTNKEAGVLSSIRAGLVLIKSAVTLPNKSVPDAPITTILHLVILSGSLKETFSLPFMARWAL
jgi:hypothetical protein